MTLNETDLDFLRGWKLATETVLETLRRNPIGGEDPEWAQHMRRVGVKAYLESCMVNEIANKPHNRAWNAGRIAACVETGLFGVTGLVR